MDSDLAFEIITVPLFTGVIGYLTNWSGVVMMFDTVEFHGFRVPGLRSLFPYLPRRVQVLPIFKDGARLGWQGMVPSRAEKLASVAIDRSLSKIGGMSDFYRELEPDTIVEQLVEIARPEIPGLVDRVMAQENSWLWTGLPGFAKRFVYQKVDADLHESAGRITAEVGEHLDDLIDIKEMATRYLTNQPALLNDIFRDFGGKELRFMKNFGFYFGYPMGFLLVAAVQIVPQWWMMPIGGAVIGWFVNYLAITIVFEPIERSMWAPWKQGLLIKRRNEVIKGFARTFAYKVITIDNVVQELLHGPRGDRTRKMLEMVLHRTVDDAVGHARLAVRATVGSREYERLKDAAMPAALDLLPRVIQNKEFADDQARKIASFIEVQMTKLDNEDFQEVLRSAFKQDEWLLFLHGGVLGTLAGFLHLAIFGI